MEYSGYVLHQKLKKNKPDYVQYCVQLNMTTYQN